MTPQGSTFGSMRLDGFALVADLTRTKTSGPGKRDLGAEAHRQRGGLHRGARLVEGRVADLGSALRGGRLQGERLPADFAHNGIGAHLKEDGRHIPLQVE